MTVLSRRPNAQPKGESEGKRIQQANKELRYIQGFTATVGANASVPVPITLNSSGKKLLGISIMPASGTNSDIANFQVTFLVNNNNVLLNMGANNANPNFVGNMIFLPTPQPLLGNDSISLNVTNNTGVSRDILVNVFYVPRKG